VLSATALAGGEQVGGEQAAQHADRRLEDVHIDV
jgi:hypothetical protein